MYPMFFSQNAVKKHEKGEVIEVITKYGKENECIVFNLIYEREGFYYYSIVRADGFNVQEWAKQRAERAMIGPSLPDKKSKRIFQPLEQRTKIFFLLESQSRSGTIVKNGIEKRLMMLGTIWEKVLNLATRLPNTKELPKYWEEKANTINLSMPESIDFYEHKLEKAKEYHEGLKSGKYPREHSYSLTYAKKLLMKHKRITNWLKSYGEKG